MEIPSTWRGRPRGTFGTKTACHDTRMELLAKSYTIRYWRPDRSWNQNLQKVCKNLIELLYESSPDNWTPDGSITLISSWYMLKSDQVRVCTGLSDHAVKRREGRSFAAMVIPGVFFKIYGMSFRSVSIAFPRFIWNSLRSSAICWITGGRSIKFSSVCTGDSSVLGKGSTSSKSKRIRETVEDGVNPKDCVLQAATTSKGISCRTIVKV